MAVPRHSQRALARLRCIPYRILAKKVEGKNLLVCLHVSRIRAKARLALVENFSI